MGKGLSPFKKLLATRCMYVTAKHHQHLLHANIRKVKSAATVAIVGVLAIIGVALIVRCYLKSQSDCCTREIFWQLENSSANLVLKTFKSGNSAST